MLHVQAASRSFALPNARALDRCRFYPASAQLAQHFRQVFFLNFGLPDSPALPGETLRLIRPLLPCKGFRFAPMNA
jgi:hypothetical protein